MYYPCFLIAHTDIRHHTIVRSHQLSYLSGLEFTVSGICHEINY